MSEHRYKVAMAKIRTLRNVAGHDWGWWSSDHQCMHIQTLDEKKARGSSKSIHVWLEHRGIRVFDINKADTKELGTDVRQLQGAVEKERSYIEDKWTTYIMRKGWIRPVLHDGIVTLFVYTDHNQFQRHVDLRRDVGLIDEIVDHLIQSDIGLDLEICALTILRKLPEDEQIHVYLPEILWVDSSAA